ncbi:MAG TPA: sigma 54-interacting transcriptional regulator [Candidatus Margulisiibacteriota bacterium]|nr:sigma 54-interacting transcriptional regulator [Candidatus Margulisiibacteriota bacterium]
MADLADERAERLRNRLKWFLFFRVLIVSVFLGALALVYLGEPNQRYAVSVSILLMAIATTYALTIVSAVLLLRLRQLNRFASVQLLFDILLTTGVIFVTGGADSPFGSLYSLVVINAAVLMSTPGAIGAAAGSSICYAALVAVLGSGLVARPDYPFPPAAPDLHFALRFATTNATFFLIALLASSLVRRLHHTERLLEEREAERDRLASLQEAVARNIGSALITTDVAGCVTSANATAEEVAGMPAAELMGREMGSIFAPLRHTVSGRQQFLQSSSTIQPTEFIHRLGDSSELNLRCSTAPLRDTYGNPIGALYILQDVSALRRLEERLCTEAEPGTGNESLVPDDDDGAATDGLIGSSPAIRQVRDLIERAARTDATLLITGESGTGKELVARAVHARSARQDRPFVAVNCGAIPDTLIESELFGHVKGAFTGAVAARAGLFRMADGGTIFLDEIGDLPLALQVKLLRVLQERSFTPIGADANVTVDVRVVAATNRHLGDEVNAGRFRTDLFYRLNVLTIELPPLRQRRQDIAQLTRKFLRQFSDLHGKHVQRLSVAAARRLQEYAYPGNVRELENIIEHAVALSDGETVHEPHLPEYVLKSTPVAATQPPPPNGKPTFLPAAVTTAIPILPTAPAPTAPGENLDDNLAAYEKSILQRALTEAGGVKKRAAELLGINYRSFRHRLQKYGLNDSSPE